MPSINIQSATSVKSFKRLSKVNSKFDILHVQFKENFLKNQKSLLPKLSFLVYFSLSNYKMHFIGIEHIKCSLQIIFLVHVFTEVLKYLVFYSNTNIIFVYQINIINLNFLLVKTPPPPSLVCILKLGDIKIRINFGKPNTCI